MSERSFTVCVYCGSRPGLLEQYEQDTRALGHSLARRGWRLMYGGGNVGLMGELADAVLHAGGQVHGVIPEALMRREVGHRGLQHLQVVQTMHERKHAMAEGADAFVALPGGIGTLEEFFEVWTWRQLGYHQRPIALLNSAGFYDPLLVFLRHTVEQGFLAQEQLDSIVVEPRPEDLLNRLQEPVPMLADKLTDLRRI
jgi:uncharacterized protein (TIGR00730 family)